LSKGDGPDDPCGAAACVTVTVVVTVLVDAGWVTTTVVVGVLAVVELVVDVGGGEVVELVVDVLDEPEVVVVAVSVGCGAAPACAVRRLAKAVPPAKSAPAPSTAAKTNLALLTAVHAKEAPPDASVSRRLCVIAS